MIINLQDLAAKRAKPDQGLTISDHTLDLAKFTGSELMFSGTGSRGLVIKNAKQVHVTFKDVVIDNAGTGVTLKFDGVTDEIHLNGINARLFGKAGNSASQMIYFVGVWSDVEISGFEIDQRRDSRTGSTVTGACVQLAGVSQTKVPSLGEVHIHDMILRNAGDEGVYVNHFKKVADDGTVMADGEKLTIEGVEIYRSGRDYLQQQGFRNTIIRGCYGDNGALEAHADHMSALSMNGNTETLLVEGCNFRNIPQFIYSGGGKSIDAKIKGNSFSRGTTTLPSNQIAYLKGPGFFAFENNYLDAIGVKRSILCADGCTVGWDVTNTMIGSRVDYTFNGGNFIEAPVIINHPAEVIEEKTSAGVKYFLNWNGKRIEL
jgi:hypothetical protein